MSEEDIDIYQDLPTFADYGSPNHREFDERITELGKQLDRERQKNKNLQANISALLKTAKTEIARKDRTINDLRESLNNFQFRRYNKQPIPKIETTTPVRPEEIKFEWNFQESKPQPAKIPLPISTLYSQRWQQKLTNENFATDRLSPKKEPEEQFQSRYNRERRNYNARRSRSPNYRHRGYSRRDSRPRSRHRERSYSRDRQRYERPRRRREYSTSRHDDKLKSKEEEISLHLSLNVSHRRTSSPADVKVKCEDEEKEVVVEQTCNKKILTARRRRPIKLTDSNAAMIIVVDDNIVNKS